MVEDRSGPPRKWSQGAAVPYRRLLQDENGQHPRRFMLYVGQMVEELERMDRPFYPNDIHNVILSGLPS